MEPERPPHRPSLSTTSVTEGVSIELHPATLLRRSIAYLIDIGLITTVVYLMLAILVFASIFGATILVAIKDFIGGDIASMLGIALLVLGILGIVSLYDGYFLYLEYTQGTTLGKRLFGLKVVSLSGNRLTIGTCLIREVLRWIDCLFIFPGLISILMTSRRQRLGDLLAGTMVVHSATEERARESLYLSHDHFMMMRHDAEISPVSAELREHYLRFAFRYFIANSLNDRERITSMEYWSAQVLPLAKFPPHTSYDNDTVLRFFAEYLLHGEGALR